MGNTFNNGLIGFDLRMKGNTPRITWASYLALWLHHTNLWHHFSCLLRKKSILDSHHTVEEVLEPDQLIARFKIPNMPAVTGQKTWERKHIFKRMSYLCHRQLNRR